jgi:hypothetical protein
MDADVFCNNDGRNTLTNNGVPITVALENLNSRKINLNYFALGKNKLTELLLPMALGA